MATRTAKILSQGGWSIYCYVMSFRLAVNLSLAICTAACVLFGQTVDRIDITSSWNGLGTPEAGRITITGTNGNYSSVGRKISAKAVKELLTALDGPVVPEPSLAACGIDEQWLADNYTKALTEYTHRRLNTLSREQVGLFRSHFANLQTAGVAFAELFKHGHTDDFPKVSVTVTIGGREYGVRSDSQHPFMLPWLGVDRPRGGYDCRIGRAVAALVESRFPNRSRLLSVDGLRWQLAAQVMQSVRREWDLLDTQHRIGSDIAPVLAQYSPLQSAISNLSSIDLYGDQSWNAKLRSAELPRNFVIGVSLRYHSGKLGGVEALLADVPRYTRLVFSVPWLYDYLTRHPSAQFELRFVNGRSLSPKALRSLVEDLRLHSRAALADLVLKEAIDSAFLEINDGAGCWSRAIVLPTREVLLWHFRGDSVLGFRAQDLQVWDYYGWHSTGTLIAADGAVQR